MRATTKQQKHTHKKNPTLVALSASVVLQAFQRYDMQCLLQDFPKVNGVS